MPESDAEARSRERREEAQQQQELLNYIRDNNSIFDDGQMEGDDAKDWMSRNPGDAFQNIVKILKEHHPALNKLIRLNNGHGQKIYGINNKITNIDARLVRIDEAIDKIRKNIDILLKEKRQAIRSRKPRIDRLENSLKNFQQEKRKTQH